MVTLNLVGEVVLDVMLLKLVQIIKIFKAFFESLESSIQWFDSKEAFHAWFKERDWKGQFSWHDGVQEFIKDVNKYFGE